MSTLSVVVACLVVGFLSIRLDFDVFSKLEVVINVDVSIPSDDVELVISGAFVVLCCNFLLSLVAIILLSISGAVVISSVIDASVIVLLNSGICCDVTSEIGSRVCVEISGGFSVKYGNMTSSGPVVELSVAVCRARVDDCSVY